MRVWTLFRHRLLLLLELQDSVVVLALSAGISELIEIDPWRGIAIDLLSIVVTDIGGQIGLVERTVLLLESSLGHWFIKESRVNICA